MAIRLRILFISLQRTTWTHTGEADPDITAPTDLTTTPAIITTVTMATVTAEAPGMCFKKKMFKSYAIDIPINFVVFKFVKVPISLNKKD